MPGTGKPVPISPHPPISEAGPDEPMHAELDAWGLIWKVSGPVWLVTTVSAVLWMLPYAGTRVISGEYAPTSVARVVEHAVVFLSAAVAYRIAIALGWPQTSRARIRVVAANILLAGWVLLCAEVAIPLTAGFIDGQTTDMRESLQGLPQLFLHLPVWVSWLRFFLPPYVLGLFAIALVVMVDRHHREVLRGTELARAYAEARMSALSAQLQPHFLFNSLHATMGLINESPSQALVMLARLGDFLRHALETSHSPWVDVATELAGLNSYLAVQQTRFSDRLNIAIDASPDTLDLYVPSLMLQPLAENAIEHGRTESGPALRVRVVVALVGERLRVTIHNSSPQLAADLSPTRYGRGLANVSLRLRAAYGDDARLIVGPDEQGGTTATLDLPPRRSPAPDAPHS
ncbi:MAG TPA: histidine kinase [Steroidobacteraceae bacterium]|nr:histidine kinase [Steroidobacteraceae bacterium]